MCTVYKCELYINVWTIGKLSPKFKLGSQRGSQRIVERKSWLSFLGSNHFCKFWLKGTVNIENRIYIRVEFTKKKCKTAILLYCFHTAGILYIIMLYNLFGPGTSFYRKSKINIKRKPNYEIGWFHDWPMIISHKLYAFHYTNDGFPL